MARRQAIIAIMAQQQRERERQQAAQIRAARQAELAAERAKKAYERTKVADEKERKRLLVESQLARVQADNDHLNHTVSQLESLLVTSLDNDPSASLTSMQRVHKEVPFDPGNLGVAASPPQLENFIPKPPSGLQRHLPYIKRRHEETVEKAHLAHNAALSSHVENERRRTANLEASQKSHQLSLAKQKAEVEAHNEELEKIRHGYESRSVDGIINYFALVLNCNPYPPGFNLESRLAYVPESKQLVIEFELPTFEIVPEVGSYKYEKTTGKTKVVPRPNVQRRALYTSVVAQITLRVIREVFASDTHSLVDTVVFNGHVRAIDPGTGQSIHPCLVTVRTPSESFARIDLSRVDPIACLKTLNAGVSKSPSELVPVRPVLEFSMVDPRFVEETDLLSELDTRPNLMELTPSEFEILITNLFEKMGLETRQTRPSRDGGVDCVAYDPRPVLGGKVVIQAKRYKNTVGVSAVRDLFGTVHNEGASKGILITTSGFGKASFEFADGKPLELLSGSNLLFLLAEHAGIEARIEPPDDWTDPIYDQDI